MKQYNKIIALGVVSLVLMFSSCTKDLDVIPLDPNIVTSATVYDSPEAYKEGLAKLYATFALSGQRGPAGLPDIEGIDEGFSNYLRQYWNCQELTTDEAVIAWNDATIKDFHWQTWTPTDVFISAIYSRILYTVTLCNEYIRATSGNEDANIQTFHAEARFLRALAYSHAIDLFGNVPFVTEKDAPGAFFPKQISRAELFSYVESELLDIEDKLGAPRFEYGRADQAGAWMLLAKLYLNAQVYIGQDKYTECITYTKKVIDSPYSLNPVYQNNFVADNETSPEIILPITYDGDNTRSYGGMVYLIHAAIGGTMPANDFGVGGGWGGIRTTSAFVSKFGPAVTKSAILKSAASYPVIYVPGAYQGWDPATASQLASVNSDNNYEGYIYFAEAGEFKFTTGPNWDENYGDNGADGTLDAGGGNLSVAEAGLYKINVNLDDLTYSILKTDWGVIGSATADGWNSDQDMAYDTDAGVLTVTLDLTEGEIKFRANNDWGLNYGDTGANGILSEGGDNIAIGAAGTYDITLNLGTPDYTYTIVRSAYDRRAMFWTDGQSLEIDDIAQFTEGWAITKFKNVTSTGAPAPHAHPDFVDTDYPLFRLSDAYLMYAEAVLRNGSGGSMSEALNYVNAVRERAYNGDKAGDITSDELTLDFILDERARELYWEGHRRTDLIRFGKFTDGNYQWPWKGKVKEGQATESYRNLFPIPASDLGANPTLVQNPGY
ncbi:MAG: RagB/SusD family nutrient uptake outer membrane protein [Chlorobi bacterium]|nr:RagB/SusD family nutrient uptake outer membrane protein [Chlorobiota bacterium]